MDTQTSSKLDKSYLRDYIPQGRVIAFRNHIHRLCRVLIGVGFLRGDLIFRLMMLWGDLYNVGLGFGISNPGRKCGNQDMRRCGSSNPFRKLVRIGKWRMIQVIALGGR